MPQHYPFTAVAGCDIDDPAGLSDLGLSLILTTIHPAIGGVLVRGEKGTAKSTAVRALPAVLPPIDVVAGDRFSSDPYDASASSPDGPFGPDAAVENRPIRLVELPVGASEDRVIGSLHLERALADGKVEFEPGLLARAHRGILYVDEVNLLHDHLVDLLLDAAAMGRVTVERDGVSVEHAARFVLIGTMNPEEGELRPQLLDRFGLTAEVAAPRDPVVRADVVRRRLAFDADPAGFLDGYRDAEKRLTARVEEARRRLGLVQLSDAALTKITEVCAAFEVDGLRADIVTARAAVAHAAWAGRDEVTKADIRRAATLALPHRRRRNPFDAPGLDEELLDRILGDDEPPPEPPPDGSASDPEPDDAHDTPADGAPEHGSSQHGSSEHGASEHGASEAGEPPPHGEDAEQPTPEGPPGEPPTSEESTSQESTGAPATAPTGSSATSTVSAGAPYRPKLLTVRGVGAGTDGRRSRAITSSGRRIGATPGSRGGGSLHLLETIRTAAGHQAARGRRDGRLLLRPDDLRVAVREGREANLVLFCVDASGSMAARKRMTHVKTAVVSLLLDAYRRRDKVGLVTFRGHEAQLVLPPTRSIDIAATRLDELPGGGRTPLAEGLLEAARVLQRERLRDARLRPLLVLVTDGRATGGADAVSRSLMAADHVAAMGISSVVVDSESGPLRLGLAAALALRLHAEHLPVGEVSAEALTSVVQGRVA